MFTYMKLKYCCIEKIVLHAEKGKSFRECIKEAIVLCVTEDIPVELDFNGEIQVIYPRDLFDAITVKITT